MICPVCDGFGEYHTFTMNEVYISTEECEHCKGKGEVEDE